MSLLHLFVWKLYASLWRLPRLLFPLRNSKRKYSIKWIYGLYFSYVALRSIANVASWKGQRKTLENRPCVWPCLLCTIGKREQREAGKTLYKTESKPHVSDTLSNILSAVNLPLRYVAVLTSYCNIDFNMTQGLACLAWQKPHLSSLSVEDEVIGLAEVKSQGHCDLICWLCRSACAAVRKSRVSDVWCLILWLIVVVVLCDQAVCQSLACGASPDASKTPRPGGNSSFPAVVLLWLPVCLPLLDICVLSYVNCSMFVLQVWKNGQPGG